MKKFFPTTVVRLEFTYSTCTSPFFDGHNSVICQRTAALVPARLWTFKAPSPFLHNTPPILRVLHRDSS